jgi:hypothetical protein
VEAASLPVQSARPRLFTSVKERRRARRAGRLASDAQRFERAARRLESQIGADAWQVKHLRRSAVELHRLACEEAGEIAVPAVATRERAPAPHEQRAAA